MWLKCAIEYGDIECESFTVIPVDSLLVYEKKYYLQVHLDDSAYKIASKQMAGYLDDNINAVLR